MIILLFLPYEYRFLAGLTNEIILEDLSAIEYDDYITTQSTRLYAVIIWARCSDGQDRFVTYSPRPKFVNLEDRAVYTLEELQQRLANATARDLSTEDNINGKLSNSRFQMLSDDYEQEQEELREELLRLNEDIGMSRKQVQKMLISEGLYYAGITLILVLSIGNLIAYGIFKLFQRQVSFAVFTYPLIPAVIIVLVILAVCLITPERMYCSLNKEKIVNRLRDAE